MRVAVYYNNRDVRVEERPVPSIGPDDLLLKVRASGICGSDVMEWYRIQKAPLILGHEVAGEIEAVGENVKRFRPGQRVFVSHHVPCNSCRYCLRGQHTVCETLHTTNFDPGGFSEYIRVPALNVDRGVFPLPDDITFEEGSIVEPLACTIRAQRLANVKPGDTVLVIGSGVAGILHIALARSTGVGRIIATDISDYRLKAAGRFGADLALKGDSDVPNFVRQSNDGRLADVVIVCTGAPAAFAQAFTSVDRGGTVVFFATTPAGYELPIRIADIWRNGITMLPSYGAAPVDIMTSIDLLRNHRVPVSEMVTHRLPLDQASVGFQLVADARDSMKVVLHM
jgi:L-iditol 2-dehydrogenase